MLESQQGTDVVERNIVERTGKALEKIITSGVDFPTSVLVWHIATDMCYYFGDNASTHDDDYDHSSDYDESDHSFDDDDDDDNDNDDDDSDEKKKRRQMKKRKQMKKHKQVSRELSNYVTYLVFKCGVMLTTNSQLVHDEVHREITTVLSRGYYSSR